ncbi:MAG: hypothetical protein EBQ55_00310 [Actinobacteria bacterium]|nr:hypothetical protein [Actinomycetota bacterium]
MLFVIPEAFVASNLNQTRAPGGDIGGISALTSMSVSPVKVPTLMTLVPGPKLLSGPYERLTTVVCPWGFTTPRTVLIVEVLKYLPKIFVLTIGGLPNDFGVSKVIVSEETLPEELEETIFT